MYKKMPDSPDWLIAKLHMLKSASGSDCQLGGDTVSAALFGGKFGPMVEPLVTEVISPNKNNEDLFHNLKKNNPTIVWRPFINGALGSLENIKIGLEDNIPVVYFTSEKILNDLEQGIIRNIKDNASINRLVQNYPSLKINDQDKNVEILTSHSALLIESQKNSILKNQNKNNQPILFPANTITLTQEILRWHSQNSAHMEWVSAPPIGDAVIGNPWEADDLSFRNWLLQQSELSYSGNLNQTDEIIHKGLSSQATSQKGTHQGWKTWQHALNTTMRLETDHLPSELKKPMRIAMLMHDVGKTNHKTLWAAGCHAAHGSKIWKRSGIPVSQYESALITFIIKNHDILGTLDKTIKNPHYAAGISVEEAVERIKESPLEDDNLAMDIICAINDADIGSLSTLRYLTGLTTMLSDVVRTGLAGGNQLNLQKKPQPV